MATKPAQQPEVWASALVYASGVKSGQFTKATSESAAAVEGHKPGPVEPTTANEFNVFENKMSLLCRWLFQGRFDKMDDAHVVETDGDGLLSARAADFGDATKPGPSLFVTNSNTDWTATLQANDHDGLRLQGNYSAAAGDQLCFIDTSQDNTVFPAAMRIRCTAINSCGAIKIEANAQGTIGGENALAAISVDNSGGVGLQVRTAQAPIDAVRIINRTDGATSLRCGFGNLEGVDKNLQGLAINARGGDADTSLPVTNAGNAIMARAGDGGAGTFNVGSGFGLVAIAGVTTTSTSGGGAISATGSDFAPAIVASHDSGSAEAFVIECDTGSNIAGGIHVESRQSGGGVFIESQRSTALFLSMTADAGVIAPAMTMAPQARPTTFNTGDVWHESTGGGQQLFTAMEFGVLAYLTQTYQPPCYARSQFQTLVTLSVSVNSPLGPAFTYDSRQEPGATTEVRATIWGFASTDGDAATDIDFELVDVTAADAVMVTTTASMRDIGDAGGNNVYSITMAKVYSIPAGGARSFQLRYTMTGGISSQVFSGFAEIQEIRGP